MKKDKYYYWLTGIIFLLLIIYAGTIILLDNRGIMNADWVDVWIFSVAAITFFAVFLSSLITSIRDHDIRNIFFGLGLGIVFAFVAVHVSMLIAGIPLVIFNLFNVI